jgi:hypothetical protein
MFTSFMPFDNLTFQKMNNYPFQGHQECDKELVPYVISMPLGGGL